MFTGVNVQEVCKSNFSNPPLFACHPGQETFGLHCFTIMYTNLLTKGRHHPTSQLLFQVLQDNAMFSKRNVFKPFVLVFYVKLVEFVQFSMVSVTNIILSD